MKHELMEEPEKEYPYTLTRNVSKEECHWLDRKFEKEEIVYKYNGHTYKLIGKTGWAFTLLPNTPPFFQLPVDAVRMVIKI